MVSRNKNVTSHHNHVKRIDWKRRPYIFKSIVGNRLCCKLSYDLDKVQMAEYMMDDKVPVGKNLDRILNLIKEGDIQNDLFDQEIEAAVSESREKILLLECIECSKSFTSTGGLARHMNSKHVVSTDKTETAFVYIDKVKIKDLLFSAANKLAKDDCFSREDRQ